MTPAEADSFAMTTAAYVHMPFCSTVCPYCNFAVVAGRDDQVARYVEAVCSEISRAEPWQRLDAVYFGGGTPSRIRPALLGRVLDALASKHGIAIGAEMSIEANPEDFTATTGREFQALGFNRVSFGAQSFDPVVLPNLGRRHEASHIEASARAARESGIENMSIDLIYGEPDESDQSWVESVSRAITLDPTHMSCYALTVEPGTPLGRAVNKGAAGPDPDTQADRYEAADHLLTQHGFDRYEVSNWSKPGYECRYNLTVWAQGEYEGYGNGAHGFRDSRRYRNHRRLDAYIARVEAGDSPRAGEDHIEGWDAEMDRLFVGLRRTVGVTRGSGTDALRSSWEGQMLIDAGVIAEDHGRLRILNPLLTDAVHRSVLAQRPPIVGADAHA